VDKVFVSWSGGKDSCFACYQAAQNGLKPVYLLNMVNVDAKQSWFHGLSPALMKMQAQAIGIPLVQRRTTMAGYETDFKKAVLALKKEGVSGGVFGDIDLAEHREWIEKTCQQVGVTPHLPLWGLPQEQVLSDFIKLGFEAVVLVAKADLFGEDWLGQRVDSSFFSYLSKLKQTNDTDFCGEAGEYHTFVINGPLFNQRVEVLQTRKVLREGYWRLEILDSELRAK
jgi:diphthine-ammonia ligase